MRKLIHSRFELDLSPFKISDTEVNNWFSDSFFVKYSFPFEIDLVKDLDIAFGFISQYNSDTVETYFDVLYVNNNTIEKAIFEVESYQDKLSCTLRFGFEQLPSFDKLLSELSLQHFTLPSGTTIYDHAETIVSETWPDVNYNFPQIHVDKYDTADELWTSFEKTINNRVAGNFLINEVVDDVSINRNIMQPLPYWIHILERGMADAGYTLSGEILDDPLLKNACLFGDVDYFKQATTQEGITVYQMSEDAISVNYDNSAGSKASVYYSHTILAVPGKYNIVGTIKGYPISRFLSYIQIKYRNIILYRQESKNRKGTVILHEFNIDIYFETIADFSVNDITIEAYQYFTTGQEIIDLLISCIRIDDGFGVAVPSIINENKVDLRKAVPNITFLDFIKVVKNWFNYDLSIVDKLAVMNPIESKITYDNALPFIKYEIKRPLRKFNKGQSFLLQFQAIENKNYTFLPVFHINYGIFNSGFKADDKTTTIEINALPLPLLNRGGIQTAFALEQNDSKVYLVNYDGLYNGNNLAQATTDYLIPNVHLLYWQKWFNFRINAQSFLWQFKIWNENLINLTAKTKIFAYNKYHIIKTINKTEIKPDLFEIDIETETLE